VASLAALSELSMLGGANLLYDILNPAES